MIRLVFCFSVKTKHFTPAIQTTKHLILTKRHALPFAENFPRGQNLARILRMEAEGILHNYHQTRDYDMCLYSRHVPVSEFNALTRNQFNRQKLKLKAKIWDKLLSCPKSEASYFLVQCVKNHSNLPQTCPNCQQLSLNVTIETHATTSMNSTLFPTNQMRPAFLLSPSTSQ